MSKNKKRKRLIMRLTFQGEPLSGQSVRVARRGKAIHAYQPKKNLEYKSWIKYQALQQLPKDFNIIETGVRITKCHFMFAPLKSFSKKKKNLIESGIKHYKTTRPDLNDNLFKLFIDALSGIVWKDDSLICSMTDAEKYYDFKPGIILNFEECAL